MAEPISIFVLLALTTALVEIIKQFIKLKPFIPFLAILIGVGLNYLGGLAIVNSSWQATVLWGVIIGLSGAGLFDFTKLSIVQPTKSIASRIATAFRKQ
jgi:predicted tellurium resistance membrane protein TerC